MIDISYIQDHQKQRELREIKDFYNGDVKQYIRIWTKEEPLKYQWRQDVTYYQDFVTPVVSGLTGMLMRKPILTNDLDEEFSHDVDLLGTSIHGFVTTVATLAIRDGLAVIVSTTNRSNNIISKQDEEDNGIRAYLKHYEYKDVLSSVYEGGKLKQIVLKEQITRLKSGSEYESEVVTVYTLHRIGGGKIYESVDLAMPILVREWNNNLTELPVSIVYGSLEGTQLQSKSIIKNLVQLNKAHLNLKSGIMNIVHIASNPVPVFYGKPTNDNGNGGITIGVNTPIVFPTAQGNAYKFEWVEINGGSVKIAENEVDKLENYIISSGFSILREESFSTATEAKIADGKNKSILSIIAYSLQNAVNKALKTCEEMGNNPIGTIVVNQDFNNLTVSPQILNSMIDLYKSGGLSLSSLWLEMQKGELLLNVDIEKEAQKLKDELELGEGL